MAKNCSIHYELTQSLFEESESQIFDYQGKILKIDEKYHLHYSFMQDNISTDVLMVIGNKSITVKQSGGIVSQTTYLPGQITDMIYKAPTGSFAMKCFTTSYHLKSCESNINILISYDLLTGNDLLCSNKLNIQVNYQ